MSVEHTIINLQTKNIFGTNIIFGTNLAPTRWHQLFTLPTQNASRFMYSEAAARHKDHLQSKERQKRYI